MKFGFHRRSKKREIPEGLWMKCDSCGEMLFRKDLQDRLYVCPKCDYHYAVPAMDRVKQLLDEGTFEEWFADLAPADPLKFDAGKPYAAKVKETQQATGLKDAVVVGKGSIKGASVAFACTDFSFMAGSMGSVVGEKLARTVEEAGKLGLPVIIVSASGGGARMQESSVSLMQMAKVSAALARFGDKGGFFVSVLANPTMGGVMASYASLGDVILAEPKALVGFTGPRVIQQTIRQELPEGFQTSEFMLQHGFIDTVAHRKDLKDRLALLLGYCAG